MIEELLPAGIVSAENWGDDDSAHLFPEEHAAVRHAIESRIREFATTRFCARRALGNLGISPVVIGRGSSGEPNWPSGVIGSMTHCAGYRAAAVALQTSFTAIGIDAEVHDALSPDVLQAVCVDEEIAWLRTAPCAIHWDRVIFSAKESVYKAWFPLTKLWLDFNEVRVVLDTAESTFLVHPLGSIPEELEVVLMRFTGRILIRHGIILTAVVY